MTLLKGKNVYLEISARRTGKTTRLMKEAKRQITNGQKVVVVSKADLDSNHIKQFLPTAMTITPNQIADTLPKNASARWFFDEMDFMIPHYIPIIKDGYYVGTLSDLALSKLVRRLLDANGGFAWYYNCMDGKIATKKVIEPQPIQH